jgi:hypothetical protein
MPDNRHHRGTHPQDKALFAPGQSEALCRAVADMSFLLSRDYPSKAALKLVGDRYALTVRQRQAVSRSACSDSALMDRLEKRLQSLDELKDASLRIDGFNCLITIESAISGGLIIRGRDGAHRDMASTHGSYRKVDETRPAILMIGKQLHAVDLSSVCWYLDSPVSNAGRLAQLLRRTARENNWPWEVVLLPNPDRQLVETAAVVASCDSWVLDRCTRWIDLPGVILSNTVLLNQAWIVDLGRSLQ